MVNSITKCKMFLKITWILFCVRYSSKHFICTISFLSFFFFFFGLVEHRCYQSFNLPFSFVFLCNFSKKTKTKPDDFLSTGQVHILLYIALLYIALSLASLK